MANRLHTALLLGPAHVVSYARGGSSTSLNSQTPKIDSATAKLAYKFFVDEDVVISSVDCMVAISGSMTGILLKAEIQTDAADIPSGTVVGGATGTFSPPSANGFIGQQNLTSNASLSAGQWYWLVLYDGGGTAPTAVKYIAGMAYGGTGNTAEFGRIRQYNGTNWTTVSVAATNPGIALGVSGGGYVGSSVYSANMTGLPSGRYVYGTKRLAIKFRSPFRCVFGGAYYYWTPNSSPGNLEVKFYSGDTLVETVTLTADSTAVSRRVFVRFAPYTLIPGNDYWVTIHQVSDGGSSTNSYRGSEHIFPTTYRDLILPDGWGYFEGTDNTPSNYTEVASGGLTYFPNLLPAVFDANTPVRATIAA